MKRNGQRRRPRVLPVPTAKHSSFSGDDRPAGSATACVPRRAYGLMHEARWGRDGGLGGRGTPPAPAATERRPQAVPVWRRRSLTGIDSRARPEGGRRVAPARRVSTQVLQILSTDKTSKPYIFRLPLGRGCLVSLLFPGKSALGKGWGAWGEGEPLPRRRRGSPSPQIGIDSRARGSPSPQESWILRPGVTGQRPAAHGVAGAGRATAGAAARGGGPDGAGRAARPRGKRPGSAWRRRGWC